MRLQTWVAIAGADFVTGRTGEGVGAAAFCFVEVAATSPPLCGTIDATVADAVSTVQDWGHPYKSAAA
eukprot:1155224-Pelagomonas_calceolata.AAC.1